MPSAKILEQKQKMVEELAEKIKNAGSGVLVNYCGITVEKDTALRKSLREAGVEYTVIKNTYIKKACEIAGLEGFDDVLEGMTAFAISEDPVAPAKILKEYAEKIETFELKGGFVDGGVLDQKGVLALAEIPSKETLICKIMLGMQSPLYKLAYALQAIIDKSGEAPAEEAPAAE